MGINTPITGTTYVKPYSEATPQDISKVDQEINKYNDKVVVSAALGILPLVAMVASAFFIPSFLGTVALLSSGALVFPAAASLIYFTAKKDGKREKKRLIEEAMKGPADRPINAGKYSRTANLYNRNLFVQQDLDYYTTCWDEESLGKLEKIKAYDGTTV